MSLPPNSDVLILGHTLEAGIAAVRLALDGWSVYWPGTPPSSTVELDGAQVPAAPMLAPSLENMPGLWRALTELGVGDRARELVRPTGLQLLGDRRRDEHGEAPREQASRLLSRIDGALAGPVRLDWRGIGSTRTRVQAASGQLDKLPPDAREVVTALDSVVGDRPERSLDALRIATAPHRLEGGRPALVRLLSERFTALGGKTSTPHALPDRFQPGLGGVRAEFRSGTHEARLAIVGADGTVLDGLLPKLREPTPTPLLRLSMLVATRGLPVALAPAAVVDGRWLVERAPVAEGRESLTLFWRDRGGSRDSQGQAGFERLKALLPFFERHVTAKAQVAEVAGHGQAAERSPRPKWRVLRASGSIAGLSGLDGGARLGLALAERARTLTPRKAPGGSTGSA